VGDIISWVGLGLLAQITGPKKHFLTQVFSGNLATVCIFRALDCFFSISCSKVMA